MKQGWEIKAFDDCIEKVKVKTKLPSSSYQKEGAFPIVSQEKELISGYWDNEEDVITLSTPATIFGDHTMVVKYIDFDFVVGADGVKILKPKSFLNPKYFYYWVRSADISSRGYARHYRYLREKTVSIPSLAEQKRIVEILDREFERIDALKANAEQNLQHAKDLFQSALKQELQPKEGWEYHKLIDIYNFIDYRGATPNKTTSGIPLITAKNIKKGYLDYSIKDFISEKEYKNRQKRGISKYGDILFTTEAPLGNVAIADKVVYSAGQRVITFQKKEALTDIINNSFYLYYFIAPIFQEMIKSQASGLTAQGIKASRLKDINIPLPKIGEQDCIASRLNKLSEQCRTLEENYKKTIVLCDDMKQALLRKAFNGEL